MFPNRKVFEQAGLPDYTTHYTLLPTICPLSSPPDPIVPRSIRPRSRYAGEFWKGGALFLPSILIRYENGAFRELSSNQRNLKKPGFRVREDEKIFLKTELFKSECVTKNTWFPGPSLTSDCCIYNFLRCSDESTRAMHVLTESANERGAIRVRDKPFCLISNRVIVGS